MSITVLVADDQDLARSGLRMILGGPPDIAVVGEPDNGAQASIQVKLDVRNRAEITAWALQRWLMPP
ncbi:MAG: hypothetical protein ACYDH5_15670 [Acidimicrobiales bacterium]